MADIDFKMTGMDAVIQRMQGLTSDMKAKGIRFSARKGSNFIAEKAKQNIKKYDDPNTPEDISKNVTVRFSTRTFKASGDIKFRVGVLGGARQYVESKANKRKGIAGKSYAVGGDKKNPGGDTWYWRFLEFGTSRIPAKSPMRSALFDNADAATAETAVQLNRWLDRYFKRIGKA